MRKMRFFRPGILEGIIVVGYLLNNGFAQTNYRIFVSDEKSGSISVINGGNFQPLKTIPVGGCPRGIQASADGKTLYVAISSAPVEPPSQLNANDDPILQKHKKDEGNGLKVETTADGIGVVDLTTDKFLRKIPAGSDPAQFAVGPGDQRLYVANEDAGTVTMIEIATEKIIGTAPVTFQPEGIHVSPDGKFFYVGCKTAGDIFAIDATNLKVFGQIKVKPQPCSIAFLPTGNKAFAAGESSGEINVINTSNHTLAKAIALPKDCCPMCVKVSADGKRVYASTGSGNTVCVIDTDIEQVVDNIKVDRGPRGISLSPDGKFLFAANGPADDVSVVDLGIGKEVVRVKLPAGSSPWDILVVPAAN